MAASHAFDDVAELRGIKIDAEQIFDQSKGIGGEFGDQVLVSGKFTNEVRDDFLDIHKNGPPCFRFVHPVRENGFYVIAIIVQAAVKNKERA